MEVWHSLNKTSSKQMANRWLFQRKRLRVKYYTRTTHHMLKLKYLMWLSCVWSELAMRVKCYVMNHAAIFVLQTRDFTSQVLFQFDGKIDLTCWNINLANAMDMTFSVLIRKNEVLQRIVWREWKDEKQVGSVVLMLVFHQS